MRLAIWLPLLALLLLPGCNPDAAPGGSGPGAAGTEAPAPGETAEGASPAPAGSPAERRMAPDFALADLEGELVRSEDLRGKTVVLDFWATWCPPCEFQVPELNAFREAHADEPDVVVLGVSVDVEGPDVVGEWVRQKDVQYDVLLGGEELARRFGALGFPTLYVLAPDGAIAMEHVGLIEVADLETVLGELRSHAASGSPAAPAP